LIEGLPLVYLDKWSGVGTKITR